MANIIQQFYDHEGNAIFPIGYSQGGCKLDLLWTNPSPSSTLGAFTVNMDLTEYDLLLISVNGWYSWNGSDDRTPFWNIVKKGKKCTIKGIVDASAGDFWRAVTASDSSIVFSTGYGTATASSNYAIPLEIYGIKMSYIVPTSVHGLQYVEV